MTAHIPTTDSRGFEPAGEFESTNEFESTDDNDCGRTWFLAFTVLFVLSVLSGRLIHLQWFGREQYAASVQKQQSMTQTLPARPGEIVDRNGHVLAITVSCSSLYIDPARVEHPERFCAVMAEAADVDRDSLLDRVIKHRNRRFLWVRRRLSEEQARRVRAIKLPRNAWGLRDEYLRQYPQQELAAHVLGTRDIDGIGHGGIEQSLDSALQGIPGKRVLTRDARGAVIGVDEQATHTAIDGKSVSLTIDSVIQLRAEKSLDQIMQQWRPKGACAVVLEPQTGEVLAMASRPGFNPNHPIPDSRFAWTNLAVSAVYEPGSTFKPIVVARAIDERYVDFDETFDCEWGAYRMGTRILHDHHKYGTLDITDILARSSNIGMAKIGERMLAEGLFRTVVDFGFARRTGIDLPGEVSGLIRPIEKWDNYSIGSIPMGQELAVTPLQMIVAYAALSNGGRLIVPHIVKNRDQLLASQDVSSSVRDSTGVIVSNPLSKSVADWIVRGPLTAVVDRGTGKRGAIAGIEVFGKTGTAQKVDRETDGYSKTRHVCSFICGAPSHDPRVLVLVVVDEPTIGGPDYGGTVAAPAAASILRHALHCLSAPQLSQR